MSSDLFHGKIAELDVILEVLEQRAKVAESYKVLLSSKTEGYISAIQGEKSPFADTSFHITNWFRNFIGVKDEAMLLINGELIRNYHLKHHKQYFHERGNEQGYYTSKAEILGLSSCCVDGLLYEIRAMERKYKKQMERDSDRVDIMANRVQDIELRLDRLCKFFDSQATVFQKELKKLATHVKSITLEITHKSENLTVQYHKNLTSCIDFSCSSKGARTGSRKQALYSGIEERSAQAESAVLLAGSTNKTTNGSFRSKMTVADAEDEADLRERLQYRAQQEELRRQAAELEAAKGPDFGFDFSIDQTKLQAGAFDLMAVPVDVHARGTTDVDGVSAGPGPAATTPLLDPAWCLQADSLDPELDTLREAHAIKVKICANNTAVSAADAGQFSRTKLSGTSIVVTSAPGVGLVQAYLSVATCVTMNFAELKDRVGASCGVLVEELLDDVCRQLWLAAPFASRGKPALDFYFCLPVSISISSTKYSSGDCMQLPSAEDLTEKRYLVKTDDRPTSLLYLNNIAKWLSTFDQESDFIEAKQQLTSLRPLIQRICDCLHDPAAPLDLSTLTHLASNDAVEGETRNRVSYLEKLLQLAQSVVAEGSALRVNLSESSGWSGCLSVLLEHASHVDATASGLTCVDLLGAVESIERHCLPHPAPALCVAASGLQYLQVLNLQHNAMLLSYVEHPWERSLFSSLTTDASSGASDVVQLPDEPESEPMDIDLTTYATVDSSGTGSSGRSEDPFERFAVCLLNRAVNLREMDLSYCVSTAQQAAALSRGLVAALIAREAAGTKPLEKVVLKGFDAFPGVIQELRRQLCVPVTGTMAGVRVIDASGFNFAI